MNQGKPTAFQNNKQPIPLLRCMTARCTVKIQLDTACLQTTEIDNINTKHQYTIKFARIYIQLILKYNGSGKKDIRTT